MDWDLTPDYTVKMMPCPFDEGRFRWGPMSRGFERVWSEENYSSQIAAIQAATVMGGTPEPLMDLARRRRVDAIQGRGKIAVANRQFAERFGCEPFQRRS